MASFTDTVYQWVKGDKNWHIPYNNALTALKAFMGDKGANADLGSGLTSAQTEIVNGRGSAASLTARLDVGINADGTLKTTVNAGVDFAASGDATTFTTATTFTVPTDRTGTYTKGRRLMLTLSGGAVYGTVLSAVFGSVTTITLEENVLDATLSAVSFGITSVGAKGSVPKHDHTIDNLGGTLPKDPQIANNKTSIKGLGLRTSLLEATANPGLTPADFFADTTKTDLTATTMDTANNAAQKVVNVAATTGFSVGDSVDLSHDTDLTKIETVEIATIQAGVSLTMLANLVNAYPSGSQVARTGGVIVGGQLKLPVNLLDNNNLLLLHFDGADQSTVFTDAGPNGHTINVGSGTPVISTAQSKFGGAALDLDGANETLSIPDSPDWDMTGNKTIDFWMRVPNFTTEQPVFNQATTSVNRHWCIVDTTGSIRWSGAPASPNGWDFSTPVSSLLVGTWHHVALVKNGTGLEIFIDGVSKATATATGAITTYTQPFVIGAKVGVTTPFYLGQIDEFKISSDVLWATNFTPPIKAYPIQLAYKSAHHRSIDVSRPQRLIDIATFWLRQSVTLSHTATSGTAAASVISGITAGQQTKYGIGDSVVVKKTDGMYLANADGTIYAPKVTVNTVSGQVTVDTVLPETFAANATLQRLDAIPRASLVAAGAAENMAGMSLETVEAIAGSTDLRCEWAYDPAGTGQDVNVEIGLSTEDVAQQGNVFVDEYTSLLEMV